MRTFFSSSNIDLVIVRENTEDLYAGVEFERGQTGHRRVDRLHQPHFAGQKIRSGLEETGVSIKPISVSATERIVRYAFQYARDNGRKKGDRRPQGEHHEVHRRPVPGDRPRVADEYPEIRFEDRIVDNMCMQLVQKPELYDVLVLPNLYGDILSDLAAGVVGGLGVAPGANIGTNAAVFEATHGSAPKYKGLNKVNPTALVLSGMLMLRYLKEPDAANRLEQAVAAVIAEGKDVTYDLKPYATDPTAVGTREMADRYLPEIGRVRWPAWLMLGQQLYRRWVSGDSILPDRKTVSALFCTTIRCFCGKSWGVLVRWSSINGSPSVFVRSRRSCAGN